jgi:Ras-related protein Rab-1A
MTSGGRSATLAAATSYDFRVKLLLVGDSGVGKSCLLLRFVDHTHRQEHDSTIGIDFRVHPIAVDGEMGRLELWDTAGQERFRTVTSAFYRGAHGVVIVYDVTDAVSFDHVTSWLRELERYGTPATRCLLIGNKSDLAARRVITPAQGQQLAHSLGMAFAETSARQQTSSSVEDAFLLLIRSVRAQQRSAAADDQEVYNTAHGAGARTPSSPQRGCC